MQSQNTYAKPNFQTLNQAIEYRSYSVPHVIHELSLKPSDSSILLALFKLQDDFVFMSKNYWGWFFATNTKLANVSHKSKQTIRNSRRRLKYLGLIDYEIGCGLKGKATKYRILIDPFYLADRALEGSNLSPIQRQ